MWSGNFKTAVLNLRMARWRSVFTMLGVIIGVCSVLTTISLGEGLKQQVVGRINKIGGDVITIRPGKLTQSGVTSKLNYMAFLSVSTLTGQDVETLQKIPSVKTVVPIDFVTAAAKSDGSSLGNISVLGTTPNMAGVLSESTTYGRFFDTDEPGQNYAVISQQIARQLFGEPNAIGQTVNILGQDFIVQGVLDQSFGDLLTVAQTDFSSAIFIPFSVAQQLTHNKTNVLQIFAVSRDADTGPAISDINKALLKNHQGQEDFTVIRQRDLINMASSEINNVTGIITGIAAISLVVAGIGIMAIMLVSVSERTREIGIRKAIGATNRQILNQFIIEGLVLTMVGGMIGLSLALLINLLVRIYTSWQPVITLPLVLLSFLVLVAVGVIFSSAPALKAARKDPIDALRGE